MLPARDETSVATLAEDLTRQILEETDARTLTLPELTRRVAETVVWDCAAIHTETARAIVTNPANNAHAWAELREMDMTELREIFEQRGIDGFFEYLAGVMLTTATVTMVLETLNDEARRRFIRGAGCACSDCNGAGFVPAIGAEVNQTDGYIVCPSCLGV